MLSRSSARALLFATTAVGVAALATSAFAQQAVAANGNASALEEVTVTATRTTSTVNKVALSVSAVTQKSLDQQGIRNVNDLSQQVPGFTYRVSGGDGNAQLSIRGIGGNAIASTSGGAPTTGVYIDDIALQKRNLNGAVSGSGAPQPLLYDLDRIEVLRGPQGTLYGGSSEGGTLRFITPQPSLTKYSGSARIGVSTIAGGGFGNEEGLALGGPIVQDKLGFRISGFRQDRPGWINSYSEVDGHQFASQINKGSDYSLRGAVLWQVTPDFKATISVMKQNNYDQDSSTVRTSSPAINIPVQTLSNCNIKGLTTADAQFASPGKLAGAYPGCKVGGTQGVSFSFPAATFGGYTVPATPWLSNSSRNGVVNGQYLTPTNVNYVPSPRRTDFTIPSLTLDYTWNDKINFKSITADTLDQTKGWTYSGGGGERTSNVPYINSQPCPSGTGLITPVLAAPNTCQINTPFIQLNGTSGPATVNNYYFYSNTRNQVTQEFRVSSVDPTWRLQLVAGAFIEHELDTMRLCAPYEEATYAALIAGYGNAEAYNNGAMNVPFCQTPTNQYTDIAARDEEVTEDEQSVFGELTFAIIPDKLKLTAGARVTNYTQGFWTRYAGPISGGVVGWQGSASGGRTITVNGVTSPYETNPNSTLPFAQNYAACPVKPESVKTTSQQTALAAAGCPYQYTVGTLHEHPITPKVGLSYQLTPNDLVYATYSEGERPGGINPPASPVLCAPAFALLGISGSPPTYQHDTVKSTEVGGKFRLFNGQAQLNVSAFHIDWEGVQFVVQLPSCTGFSFVANAGKAVSDGGELSFTGRSHGFTVNTNIAYDHAAFTENVYGPHAPGTAPPVTSLVANKGDNLGIPDWTANIGVQYDTRVMDMPAYARMDYIYTGKYMRATSAGTASFAQAPYTTPNYINGNETHLMNARVGIYYKDLEIAGYVKNLFDSREWVNLNQAVGNYYYTGNTVMPRTIGVQMNYRF